MEWAERQVDGNVTHRGLQCHVAGHDGSRVDTSLQQSAREHPIVESRRIAYQERKAEPARIEAARWRWEEELVFPERMASKRLTQAPHVLPPMRVHRVQTAELLTSEGSLDLHRADVVAEVDEQEPGIDVGIVSLDILAVALLALSLIHIS